MEREYRDWDWSAYAAALSGCAVAGHALVIVYGRPWRKLWRKQRIIRCWRCDIRIAEPLHLRQPHSQSVSELMSPPPGPGKPR